MALAQIQDLERLAGRTVAGTAVPKDLVAIKQTLHGVRLLRAQLESIIADTLQRRRDDLADLPEVIDLIEKRDRRRSAIFDERRRFHSCRFRRRARRDPRYAQRTPRIGSRHFEAEERRRTGIQSLKVRYNRVFGYYIEVTTSNLKSVPEDYLRKQTLANGERYITPDLKEYEAKVLNSESSSRNWSWLCWRGCASRLPVFIPPLKRMSCAGGAGCFSRLAEVAESQHFIRPRVDQSTI